MLGNAYEEGIEGIMHLRVGDIGTTAGNATAHLATEVLGRHFTLLEFQKRSRLHIKSQHLISALHAKAGESLHAAFALYIHNHTSTVEEEVAYFLVFSHRNYNNLLMKHSSHRNVAE